MKTSIRYAKENDREKRERRVREGEREKERQKERYREGGSEKEKEVKGQRGERDREVKGIER